MEFEGLTEEEILARAEELIAEEDLDGAQSALDAVKENSGRKYFLQSRLYKIKGWYNEERKQLKLALKCEPDNAEYKLAMEELEAFRKSDEYKEMKKLTGEDKEGCAMCCCEVSCEACAAGCCESACDGCS